MKVSVDQEGCIGCGLCVGIEPGVFFMNDDGKAEANDTVLPEQEEGTLQAIEMCPVAAISEE
ncbi:MAG TPA: ferredoxin [Lachnospiraceae bacterium]|nr:ferredoxin [Lachnospiraceae bacterium]